MNRLRIGSRLLGLVVFIFVLGLSAVAGARPSRVAMRVQETMDVKDRSDLARDIQLAKERDPKPFGEVQQLRSSLPQFALRSHGRMIPIKPMLRALGPSALHAMLEELSFETETNLAINDREAWRVGLLEAVGALEDARSLPTLRVLFDVESSAQVQRAAAVAMARLGTDRVAVELVALSRQNGPRQLSVLSAMGHCRRETIAAELTRQLAARPAEETALVIVRSLGLIASSWATSTRGASVDERARLRALSAKSLVAAVAIASPRLRTASIESLLAIDESRTLEYVEAKKANASRDARANLAELESRWRNNPLHR